MDNSEQEQNIKRMTREEFRKYLRDEVKLKDDEIDYCVSLSEKKGVWNEPRQNNKKC